MSAADAGEGGRLEAERDFLLRSLDDLESERATGGIDDASYVALHDDYTARAAAVIRALRDGVDARPSVAPVPWRRRLLVIAAVGALAIGSGVALASALGNRQPGQTSSGNTGARTSSSNGTRQQLEAAVEKDPTDVGSRLLLARYLERGDDLVGALAQYDEVIRIDPANTEAYAQSGRLLYLTAVAAPEQAAELVDRAKARLDSAIDIDAEYPDARFFRAIILANEYQDFAGAQGDLQRYLLLAPDGVFAEQARQLLADVTNALEAPTTSTTT
jgi:cytochrome c-type biogenesis protein CcmH/NrfG